MKINVLIVEHRSDEQNDGGGGFMYVILLVYEKCHWSLPAATLPCMWVVSQVGCVDTINELMGSSTR
jgi:hypothetical protein